jgi:hypothetical protein
LTVGRRNLVDQLAIAHYENSYFIEAFFPGENSIRLGDYPNVLRKWADLRVIAKQIWCPVNYKDHLVYLARNVWPLYNAGDLIDIDPQIAGLFDASAESIRRITLETGGSALDIKIGDDGQLYALCNTKVQNSKDYLIEVYCTSDVKSWRRVCQFRMDTFARSFEILDGDLYFGCGSHSNDVPDSTGDILRIKRQYISALNRNY